MRLKEFITEGINPEDRKQFKEIFKKFLPLAMHYLQLDSLPKFVFKDHIDHMEQPTFGMYVNQEKTLYVALIGRHPNDILRTVAHELAHYKQDTEHILGAESGNTGSPEENQAHALAGIVMRHFNKAYPEYLNSSPMVESNNYDYTADYNYDDTAQLVFPTNDPNTEREAAKILKKLQPKENPNKPKILKRWFVGSTGRPIPDDMKEFVKKHVRSLRDGRLVVYEYEPDYYRKLKLGSFQEVWNKLKYYFDDAPQARIR